MYNINAALTGTGFMGPTHTEALRRLGINVVGVLGSSPEKSAAFAEKMGIVSRQRAIDVFSWKSIAKQTFDFYNKCIERYKNKGKRK